MSKSFEYLGYLEGKLNILKSKAITDTLLPLTSVKPPTDLLFSFPEEETLTLLFGN